MGPPAPGDTVVTPRLLRAGSASARQVRRLAPDVPDGPFYSSEMQITSLRVPMLQIALEGDRHATIYECAHERPDDCSIDLAAGNALDDLLDGAPASIEPGTYHTVRIYMCPGTETGYTAYLAASVTLDGQRYVTDAASASGMTAGDEAGEVGVTYTGCSAEYDLPVPVTVAEGDAIDLRLYFDMRSIAWASLGDSYTANTWIPSGCTGTAGDAGPFACMAYPNVAGTVDDVPPVVEHYLVNGLATFGMFFDSEDRFFGGYTRRTYVERDWRYGVDAIAADTPLKAVVALEDGLYHVENFGPTTDGPGAFATDDFQRVAPGESFSGTFAANGEGAFAYVAQRLE